MSADPFARTFGAALRGGPKGGRVINREGGRQLLGRSPTTRGDTPELMQAAAAADISKGVGWIGQACPPQRRLRLVQPEPEFRDPPTSGHEGGILRRIQEFKAL